MIKEIWEKQKKIIIMILVLILAILISIYFINSKTNEDNKEPNVNNTEIARIVLFGSKSITLEKGENYIEPGYYAVTKDGEIKKEEVEVTGDNINTNVPGIYNIHYTIGRKKESREIIVLEKEEEAETEETKGKITLTLKGESMLILKVGEQYKEPGYIAIDSKDGDITHKVKEKGLINTGKEGTYKIEYEVENSDFVKEIKTRTIIVKNDVLDVKISGNATKYIKDNVLIRIEIDGENYNYLKNPDGTITKSKSSSYEITKNGTYNFYIYNNKNEYIKKEITVDKIDKSAPTGNCIATIENGKTTIEVSGKDNLSGINNYIYYGNNQKLKSNNNPKYIVSKEYSNVYVVIYDNVGNSNQLVCRVNNLNKKDPDNPPDNPKIEYDYLEMHFIVTGYNDDAIFIRTGKSSILIDSGRYDASKKVTSYLNGLGVTTIDAIIGSHPHYNHIQAQAKVIEQFKVKSSYYSVDLNTCPSMNYCESKDVLYIKDAIKKYNVPMNVKSVGDVITIGDMTIYIIGPYQLNRTSKYKQNDNSFIFILKYKNNTFMFTGDADIGTFNYKRLKPYADNLGISLDVDMLKYPHHGNVDLENNLLNAMTPKYVIIPNYNYTQYPTSSNKSKLSKIGANIYQNGKDGNIVLKSDGKNITVKKNQSASSYKR